MAEGAGQRLRRTPVFLVSRFGNQARAFAAPAFDEHLAFVADEEDAVLRVERAIVFQFLRARWQNPAFIPVELHRRTFAAAPRCSASLHTSVPQGTLTTKSRPAAPSSHNPWPSLRGAFHRRRGRAIRQPAAVVYNWPMKPK